MCCITYGYIRITCNNSRSTLAATIDIAANGSVLDIDCRIIAGSSGGVCSQITAAINIAQELAVGATALHPIHIHGNGTRYVSVYV